MVISPIIYLIHYIVFLKIFIILFAFGNNKDYDKYRFVIVVRGIILEI